MGSLWTKIITVYYQIVISGEYQLKFLKVYIIAQIPTLHLVLFHFRRRVLRVLVSGIIRPTRCAGAVEVGATTSKRRHARDVDTRRQPCENVSLTYQFCPSTNISTCVSNMGWWRLRLHILPYRLFLLAASLIFLTDTLINWSGIQPILPVKVSVTIATMSNFDGDSDFTCKQALNGT